MNKNIKLCINCKHITTDFRGNFSDLSLCGNDLFASKVTGKPLEFCNVLRVDECGKEAKYFEPK